MPYIFEVTDFAVTGRGDFPWDMLRFDECWPTGIEDGNAIGGVSQRGTDRRSVRLRTHRIGGPSLKRWESFGWHCAIISEEAA